MFGSRERERYSANDFLCFKTPFFSNHTVNNKSSKLIIFLFFILSRSIYHFNFIYFHRTYDPLYIHTCCDQTKIYTHLKFILVFYTFKINFDTKYSNNIFYINHFCREVSKHKLIYTRVTFNQKQFYKINLIKINSTDLKTKHTQNQG